MGESLGEIGLFSVSKDILPDSLFKTRVLYPRLLGLGLEMNVLKSGVNQPALQLLDYYCQFLDPAVKLQLLQSCILDRLEQAAGQVRVQHGLDKAALWLARWREALLQLAGGEFVD